MEAGQGPTAGFAFGRCRVLPQQRQLFADGAPAKLGGRAFDVLMALIEARGAVVSKEVLMARVWPGRIIEENSLATQIAALRAAFGAERELIRTVSDAATSSPARSVWCRRARVRPSARSRRSPHRSRRRPTYQSRFPS